MEYTFVSGDSHMDFTWLPGDLFMENAPEHLKDLMPRVVVAPTKEASHGIYNAIWVSEGKELGVYGGLGFGFRPPQKGGNHRIDRMWESGYYDGGQHPANPELRIRDQDLDGVEAEVLYGMTGAGLHIESEEVLTATYRIFNEWIADFCMTWPGRFYALACIPIHNAEVAAEELRRIAKLGGPIRGCELMASVVTHPIYTRDGFWDPLWEAVGETEMPISFHQGGAVMPVPPPPGRAIAQGRLGRELGQLASTGEEGPSQNELAYRGVTNPLIMLTGAQWLCSIIMSGACEKFPQFKFVLGEQGAGWIPFILNRLDHSYKEGRYDTKLDPPLSMLPSQYWFRQGYTTFQEEPCVGQMAHIIGEDNLIWGSDYPHPDGTWPDSMEVTQESMGQLEPGVLKKIVCDNAVKLYRIGE